MKRGTKRKSYIRGEAISESGLGKLPSTLGGQISATWMTKGLEARKAEHCRKRRLPKRIWRWSRRVLTQNGINTFTHVYMHAHTQEEPDGNQGKNWMVGTGWCPSRSWQEVKNLGSDPESYENSPRQAIWCLRQRGSTLVRPHLWGSN